MEMARLSGVAADCSTRLLVFSECRVCFEARGFTGIFIGNLLAW